jgi:hypothetical protein
MLPDDDKFCKDSRSYPYWTEWSDGELITIANDSQAVVATRKYKKECWDKGNYKEEAVAGFRAGLFLVNYRVKQKPLMGDTLELPNDLKIPRQFILGKIWLGRLNTKGNI